MISRLCLDRTWLREATWLDVERVRDWARALLTVELVVFAYMIAVAFRLVPFIDGAYLSGHFASDWISFYAAGQLTAAGTPDLAYDPAAHLAAEQRILGFTDFNYNFFFYPPVFLLVLGPLGHLQYYVAASIWLGATFAVMALVLRRITGPAALMAPFLAFPPVFFTAASGQNGFLAASLFGLGTLLLERAPFGAGLALGALCYKPHFALLVPVALVAGGHWRSVAGAACGVIVLVGASWLLLGTETWVAWSHSFRAAPGIFESGRVPFDGSISAYGAVRMMGGSAAAGEIVQALVTIPVAMIVGWVWWRGFSLPLRAMVLVAGTIIAVPVIMFYDLVLLDVCFAWFVRDGWMRGFLPWDRVALSGLYGLTLLALPLAHLAHLPIAQLLLLGLFALVMRRVHAEARINCFPPAPSTPRYARS